MDKLNDRKICFLMCVNDDQYERECLKYIRALKVPEGMEVEQLSIREAPSMAAGYNEGMNSSDAKYKVYLHQDVFITDREFLFHLLEVFAQDEGIGMFGMVGALRMPESAVMWSDRRVGRVFSCNVRDAGEGIAGVVAGEYEEVEALDGLLLATQNDLPWREDLFGGWDFYDASQSFEFRKKGYKVVVPGMEIPWCLHDDGYVNLKNYFEWCEVFRKEYGEMLHE